jgi:RNA-directed DNA polymerase
MYGSRPCGITWRFARFNLELHPDKTRLFRFGRFASQQRQERGQGKPETFDFLGFTHSCGETRQGKFIVLRQPMKKRMRAKLKEIKAELRRRLHDPVADVGKWLRSVVGGWMRYYAVPLTYDILATFRRHVTWLWSKALRRRSQKRSITWAEMFRLANVWLPAPRICHPYPRARLRVRSKARAV